MSIRQKVISGLYWTVSARLVTQVLTWLMTLVVIRLLTPADYGLLAMAMVFVNALTLLSEAGLGAALVRAPEVDDRKVRGILAAVIVVNCVLYAIQYAAAPAVALFFEEERLVSIIRILALQVLISIFSVIPAAMLARSLDFKRPSIIGLGSAICGGVTTLFLAIAGYGVWAIIVGNLATQICATTALNVVAPWFRWPDFSMKGARGLIGFGGQVTATRVLWAFYSQADMLVGGKLLGKQLLGFYSVAMDLASLPAQKMMSVFNQVAFPAFARIQDDRRQVVAALLKCVRLVSVVAFPVMWGLSSVAPEAVSVVLGAKWEQVAVPLQLLALIMPLRMLSALLPPVTDSLGRADVALRNLAISAVIMPIAFVIGSSWGLLGLSAAWVIVYPLMVLQNIHASVKVIGLSTKAFLSAVARPSIAAAIVFVAVAAARLLLPVILPEWARLVFLIGWGAMIYAIASWLMNRQGIVEILDLVRR